LLHHSWLLQQLQNPMNIIDGTVCAHDRGAGTAAAANATSSFVAPRNTLLPVLQQHPHVWQQG
jgi:hypothetical protein